MAKMMKRQMEKHNVPMDQQEKLVRLMQENPELFKKIAFEVQEKIKEGKDQMSAAMEVMGKYKNELKGLM